jgi:hypothetical protein
MPLAPVRLSLCNGPRGVDEFCSGHDEPDDHVIGRSRGGPSTTIHLACDGHGRPLSVGGDRRQRQRHHLVRAGPGRCRVPPPRPRSPGDPPGAGARRQGLLQPLQPRIPATSHDRPCDPPHVASRTRPSALHARSPEPGRAGRRAAGRRRGRGVRRCPDPRAGGRRPRRRGRGPSTRRRRMRRHRRRLGIGLAEAIARDMQLPSLCVPTSAASGMNALAHAVEALYAPDVSPVVALMAEEAARCLVTALPAVVDAPHEVPGRALALRGAWLAGACLGATTMSLHHKLCHVLGGLYDLPHAETPRGGPPTVQRSTWWPCPVPGPREPSASCSRRWDCRPRSLRSAWTGRTRPWRPTPCSPGPTSTRPRTTRPFSESSTTPLAGPYLTTTWR